MSILAWFLLAGAAAIVMMAASRIAIHHAVAVAQALDVSPFVIGVALVSIGTDIPEIVNSIVSSYLGHGDINVGDSVGSVFTQGSLVLGLFPFVAGQAVAVQRREALFVTALTVAALLLGIWVTSDGMFSRADSALVLLVGIGAIATVIWQFGADPSAGPAPTATRTAAFHIAAALAALAFVGIAAAGLVHAIVAISASLGVPEYILNFFGAALGTSLPELAVEFTALRRRQHQMALGDVLGSCLVDASLSIAVGPLFFPTAVTASLATRGALIAAVTLTVAGYILAMRDKLDRTRGSVLIGIYLAGYFGFLGPWVP